MTRVRIVVFVFTMISIASIGQAQEEGFLKRWNIFRFLHNRNRAEVKEATAQPTLDLGTGTVQQPPRIQSRTGQAPAANRPAWARDTSPNQPHLNGGRPGDRTKEGRPPTLAELRAHLVSRGIDPAKLDDRMQRMTAARQNGKQLGQTEQDEASPTSDDLRAEPETRGVDAATIDTRMKQGAARDNNGRFGRQVERNVAPNQEKFRDRLRRSGASLKSLKERFGSAAGGIGEGASSSRSSRGQSQRIRR